MDAHPLQYLGALLAMIVGVTGLFRPLAIKALVGVSYVNKVGLIEIRVLFGSFLVALPIAALLKGNSEVFEFYGLAALSAAIIKSIFTYIDQCLLKDIWVGILVDVILAALLLCTLYL